MMVREIPTVSTEPQQLNYNIIFKNQLGSLIDGNPIIAGEYEVIISIVDEIFQGSCQVI